MLKRLHSAQTNEEKDRVYSEHMGCIWSKPTAAHVENMSMILQTQFSNREVEALVRESMVTRDESKLVAYVRNPTKPVKGRALAADSGS